MNKPKMAAEKRLVFVSDLNIHVVCFAGVYLACCDGFLYSQCFPGADVTESAGEAE